MSISPRIKYFARIALATACLNLFTSTIYAKTFTLPPTNEALLGNLQYSDGVGQTTTNVSFRYNLGQNAVIAANPSSIENGPVKQGPITVPTLFMLPPLPRHGIVINLPEMRMYYYPAGSNTVMTFPIGIGKIGKTIPLANTAVTYKKVNPTWIPPEDIRAFNRDQGIELPHAMGPGPDNPLGPYAIYLRIPTYLIHSTIFPESIGRRASFGCIRMNEDDIKEFFPMVQAGTPVTIVDMPIKTAWENSSLYLETHPPLEERSNASYIGTNGAINSVQQATPENQVVLVNWPVVAYLAERPDGIPHEVGMRLQ